MTSAPEPHRIDVHAHHIAPAYREALSARSGEDLQRLRGHGPRGGRGRYEAGRALYCSSVTCSPHVTALPS